MEVFDALAVGKLQRSGFGVELTCFSRVLLGTVVRTMTALVDAPADARPESSSVPPVRRPAGWLTVGVAALVAIGVVLRFYVRSHLWLDETLSVLIARKHVSDIPGALRHDGAPPLYYVGLHFWMLAFGTSDWAVRAFSGLASVVTLPLLYLAGRRIGRGVAWAAVVIGATSPFAIHYATETRMYALVALLAVAGFLVLARAFERPTLPRLAAVALVTASLLYTHYWAIYLVAVVGAWLVWRGWLVRGSDGVPVDREPARRAACAMVAGGLLFLPWLPTFLYQAAHTGTPWARPAQFDALVDVVQEFSGGNFPLARILGLVLFGLCVLGLFGTPVDGARIELHLQTRPRGRALAIVLLGTPALAIAAGLLSHTAFVARYTSVVWPAFVLLAALGASRFLSLKGRTTILAVAGVVGLWLSAGGAFIPRTEAGEFAAALAAKARPGDVVTYCPDQLAPAVHRILGDPPGIAQVTYPRSTPPGQVDWVDYGDAVRGASVTDFARSAVARAAPGGHVWLVLGRGYRPYNGRCTLLGAELQRLTGSQQQVVRNRPIRYFEHGTLYRYGG